MMTTDATENSNLADRRGVEREASAQLTTLTSLLAGFGAWFTTLAGNETSTLFSLVVLVVTALAIFVLVLASIVGALLTIASALAIREGPLRRAETLWVAATKWGILLFLANVALLPYRVSILAGCICSILALVTAIAIFWAWAWIQRASLSPGATDRSAVRASPRDR
jgi:hypothetical protein